MAESVRAGHIGVPEGSRWTGAKCVPPRNAGHRTGWAPLVFCTAVRCHKNRHVNGTAGDAQVYKSRTRWTILNVLVSVLRDGVRVHNIRLVFRLTLRGLVAIAAAPGGYLGRVAELTRMSMLYSRATGVSAATRSFVL